jgi:hypothetical protein
VRYLTLCIILDAGKRVERSRIAFCLRVLCGRRSNLQERLSARRIELSAGFSERSGLMLQERVESARSRLG